MACRDNTKAAQAVDDVKKSVATASKVSFMHLDLASLTSVCDFVAAFSASKFGFYVTLFWCFANVKLRKFINILSICFLSNRHTLY